MVTKVELGEISSFPEIITELEEYLRDNLSSNSEISRDGNTINIRSDDLPKRRVRFLVRKYLGRSGIEGFWRLIAEGKETYHVIYRKIEES